ncbi:hypothetical protein ERJ70_05120 [Sediminibacillus dalangtanensis]|uniref:Cleaved adhesin domain-containing protein n=1 Tax=Sediminibacillus dalangtanensis TaxID=2729421 RepID=A0ABX7VQ24_9BACI|nr:hypothetical protein [Sediminibacillus dalangtanensis]QTM98731.1 hypothetical protein ERJ70_05120 [Sediminibacillus dalangtanensis]
MKKRFILSGFLIVMLAVSPLSSLKTHAASPSSNDVAVTGISTLGAGSWDKVYTHPSWAVDTSWNRPLNNNAWDTTYTVDSNGGDFAVKVDPYRPSSIGTIQVKLFEEDESGNSPEELAVRYLDSSGGWAIWRNIGGYVDGSNDTAEFYINIRTTYGSSGIDLTYYD